MLQLISPFIQLITCPLACFHDWGHTLFQMASNIANAANENATTVQTNVRVEADLWKRVRVFAINRGFSAQQVVDEALRAYLAKNKVV